MEKLDLTKFNEKLRNYALEIINIYENFSFSNLKQHVSLVKKAPTGIYDSEYFEYPAVYSLLAYGIEGLDALYELSLCGHSVSGYWISSDALMVAAIQKSDIAISNIFLTQTYINDESFCKLIAIVQKNCKDKEISDYAKYLLSKLINTYISNPDHRNELGKILIKTEIALGKSCEEGRNLIIEYISKASLNLSEEICDNLDTLVKQDLNENEYQSYFQKFPTLLDPMASSIISTQNLGEIWKTDFVIKRLDDEYIFVEIEKPRDTLFTLYPHPTNSLSHAIGQVLNWQIWIEDNIAYAHLHGFPGIHFPKGIIIIGRDKDMTTEQIRFLKCLNDNLYPRIIIFTYDNIISNARNIIKNLTLKI